MGPLDIELEWRRDAKGYHLEPAAPPNPAPEGQNMMAALASGAYSPSMLFLPEGFIVTCPTEAPGRPERILRAGGSIVPYRADEIVDLVFREFVNAKPNATGVLGFVNRFGPLTDSGHNEAGEPTSFAIAMIATMNQMIDVFVEVDGIEERRHFVERLLGADGMRMHMASLDVRLVFDRRTMRAKTQITATDLFTLLWFRMIELFASETLLRRCAHCNALFTAGPGTDRRLDAKFCSDEHRVLFHRLKNASTDAVAVPDQPRRRGRPRRAAA